jgi:hypothetical protein
VSSLDPHRIDTSVPHPARRYNYWLGGKDHFQADRDSGDAIAELFPTVRAAALANRAFMRRAVTYVARQGVRQFLDIGTGIPAPNNTHEVAQAINPDTHVVYVDNDPIVMSHARALLTSREGGLTAYLEADLRDYEEILNHPDVRRVLDLGQPVGLLLVAILHFLVDADDPAGIVAARTAGSGPSASGPARVAPGPQPRGDRRPADRTGHRRTGHCGHQRVAQRRRRSPPHPGGGRHLRGRRPRPLMQQPRRRRCYGRFAGNVPQRSACRLYAAPVANR